VGAAGPDGEVALRGELDAYTAPQLRAALSDVVHERGAKTVVLDLSGLTFIDLTGVGALVAGQNQARQVGGELVLRSLPDQTWKIFEITGLNQSFTIED
jgi:anti-sigma B factor antagonist